ncbi:MAG: ribosomal RNA small subunit methyltransferase A [Candidatus Thorarchaeota archaeon]|nr:MAG: ribosomal RNA small subunit methyltransferase A [Candidatus Thorarchaeota archaeon]
MRLLTEDRIRLMLRKYGVRPDRTLGQSFLVDPGVAREIVRSAQLDKETSVLEIGGGIGILSEMIARVAGSVHVVEVDSRLAEALREVLGTYSNVDVIEGDALEVDLPDVNRIVSNLPYSISSAITFRLMNEVSFDFAVLMYQKEFAHRLLAEPGMQHYSRLSVDAQYLTEFQHIMDVPAQMFYPVPAVDSVVVRMEPRKAGRFARNQDVFFWLVHGIYSYPNKQLRKALGIWLKNMGEDKSTGDIIIESVSDTLRGNERLRTLNQDKLITLADAVLDLIEEGMLGGPRGVEE